MIVFKRTDFNNLKKFFFRQSLKMCNINTSCERHYDFLIRFSNCVNTISLYFFYSTDHLLHNNTIAAGVYDDNNGCFLFISRSLILLTSARYRATSIIFTDLSV